ncbi:hypothetical protein D3C77_359060 [compost metagenome]
MGPGLLVLDHLLAEAGEGVGQGGVDAAQFGLARGVEGGAVADEAVAAAFRQAGLLGREARCGGVIRHRLDAGEQAGVEGGLVVGGRQDRRHFAG